MVGRKLVGSQHTILCSELAVHWLAHPKLGAHLEGSISPGKAVPSWGGVRCLPQAQLLWNMHHLRQGSAPWEVDLDQVGSHILIQKERGIEPEGKSKGKARLMCEAEDNGVGRLPGLGKGWLPALSPQGVGTAFADEGFLGSYSWEPGGLSGPVAALASQSQACPEASSARSCPALA